MKKIYLSILATLAVLGSNAQLTQATHAPAAGETYETYQCDPTGVNPGTPGAGKTWNFATIPTSLTPILSYSVLAVTGNTDYPSANISVASSTSNLSYQNTSATSLKYWGGNVSVNNVSGNLNYTAPAIYGFYPLTMNTPSSVVTGGSLNITAPTAASGTFSGNSDVIADASGTMTLPGALGIFTNVIRVVNSQTINFSVAGGFATGTLTQVNYDYFSDGTKAPIFSISTATVSSPTLGGASTQSIVTRNKNAVGIGTQTISTVSIDENVMLNTINLNVYPNPSGGQINFVTDCPDAKQLMMYDMTGKLIEKQNFTEGKLKMDVSSYNKGLYMYSVIGSNNRTLKSGKLTVSQ